MGYSNLYSTFTGAAEISGAFLLLFRRTTTLGALILIAVLSNVVLVNFAYDVPVKGLSSNLLIAVVVLAAPDVRRIAKLLFEDQATGVRPPESGGRGIVRVRARTVAKTLIVATALIGPIVFSAKVYPTLRERPALYGIWDARLFIRNGDTVPPLLTESTRWRRIVFGRVGQLSVQFLNDSVAGFTSTIDTVGHRMTMRRGGAEDWLAYARPSVDLLRLTGVVRGDTIIAELDRRDERNLFPLARH